MRTPRSVKKSCDKLFSQLIRSYGACQRCGEINGKLETAHIFSRKFGSVRFDILNAVCLDSRCHRWAHDNPVEFTRWLEDNWPGRVDRLIVRKNAISKRKLSDWLELEKELKLKIK